MLVSAIRNQSASEFFSNEMFVRAHKSIFSQSINGQSGELTRYGHVSSDFFSLVCIKSLQSRSSHPSESWSISIRNYRLLVCRGRCKEMRKDEIGARNVFWRKTHRIIIQSSGFFLYLYLSGNYTRIGGSTGRRYRCFKPVLTGELTISCFLVVRAILIANNAKSGGNCWNSYVSSHSHCSL